MMTLPQIQAQLADAQDHFSRGFTFLCEVADLAGHRIQVAEIQGYLRELEILQKLRLDLITDGRAEMPHNAPEVKTALHTPPALSDAT